MHQGNSNWANKQNPLHNVWVYTNVLGNLIGNTVGIFAVLWAMAAGIENRADNLQIILIGSLFSLSANILAIIILYFGIRYFNKIMATPIFTDTRFSKKISLIFVSATLNIIGISLFGISVLNSIPTLNIICLSYIFINVVVILILTTFSVNYLKKT